MANREHKTYPNIRETPFYSLEAGLVRFYKWNINLPGSVSFVVLPLNESRKQDRQCDQDGAAVVAVLEVVVLLAAAGISLSFEHSVGDVNRNAGPFSIKRDS